MPNLLISIGIIIAYLFVFLGAFALVLAAGHAAVVWVLAFRYWGLKCPPDKDTVIKLGKSQDKAWVWIQNAFLSTLMGWTTSGFRIHAPNAILLFSGTLSILTLVALSLNRVWIQRYRELRCVQN